MTSDKKEKIFLAAVIAVAFLIRLAAVIKYGDFWDDEMFSFTYSLKPWADSLHFWLWETNPPLHMVFLKLWFYVFPATELWARVPSLLFGTFSVWLLYKLAKQIFGKRTAFLAAVFFSLLPYHIYISATARVYSMLIFLAICSMHYFYNIFVEEKYLKRDLYIYGAVTLLLFLTHLTAGLLFLCQLVILLALKKSPYPWFKINFFPAALGAAWIVCSLAYKMTPAVATTSWFLQISLGLEQLIVSVFLLIGGPNVFPVSVAGFCLFFILACHYFWRLPKETETRGRMMFFCWAVLPIIIPLLLGVRHVKFFIVAMPAAVVIIAESLNKLFPGKKIIIPYLLLTAYCVYTLVIARPLLPLTNWKPTCNFIASRAAGKEKSAFIYNNPFLKDQIRRYCPQITAPQIPYYLNPSDWDYDYITRNYIFYSHTPEEIRQWLKDNRIGRYQSIVLLQDEYEHMPHISDGLKEMGYKLKEWQKATILGRYSLYFYEYDPPTSTKMEK